MLAHLSYYAKSYYTALAGGFLYLASVVGPDLTVADLAHVSLLHWIGFIGIVLGVPLGTAAISNGPKPFKLPAITMAAPSKDVPLADIPTFVPAPYVPLGTPTETAPEAPAEDAVTPTA